MSLIVILSILFIIFMLSGLPISFSIGISSILGVQINNFLFGQTMPLIVFPQRVFSNLADSWLLVAIPLFIFLGEVFNKSGASKYLIDFVNILVGRVRGGLAIVNILTSFFFGGISGTSSADVAAVGGILIPEMNRVGYDNKFSTVVTVTSASLGPIVPPSVMMIIYAWLTNSSVIALFAAGYIPAIFMVISLSLLSYYYSVKKGYPLNQKKEFREIVRITKKALPALVLPMIIIVGIISGIFTVTESAAVAVAYSILISFLFYKELKLSDFPAILYNTIINTGVVGLVIAFASMFSWLLVRANVATLIAGSCNEYIHNSVIFLLVSILLFLFLGTFLNATAAILMIVPLLYPSLQTLGISPIHFGIVTTVAFAIGNVTPPVGVNLFVGSAISGLSVDEMIKTLFPFLVVMILTLIIIALLPNVVLFLPNLLGLLD